MLAVALVVLALGACSTSPKPALRSDAQLCAALEDDLPGTAGQQHTVVDLLTVWPDLPAGRGDLAVTVDQPPAGVAAAVRRVAGVTGARVGGDGRVYADVPTVSRRTSVATRIRSIRGVTAVNDANAGASALYAAYGLQPRSAQQAWTERLKTLNDAGRGTTRTALAALLDAHLDLMTRLLEAPVTDLVGGKGAVFSEGRWRDIVDASRTVGRFADRTCGVSA